jgi:ankyrin repeat protein
MQGEKHLSICFREAERDIQDRNMFTPLLTAVRYDSLEVFDLLVDESTNGGTKNIDMQLLQIAAEHNSKRVAEKLIQTHDAAFLASDKNEKNLVYLATDKNSVDVLEVRCHSCFNIFYFNAYKIIRT